MIRLLTVGCLIVCIMLCGCTAITKTQSPYLDITEAHELGVTAIAFRNDSKQLASSGLRGELKIWSVPDGKLLKTIWVQDDTIRAIYWANDNTLVTSTDDRWIKVFDLHQEKITQSKQFNSTIKSLAFLKNKQMLISGHLDGTVRKHRYPTLKTITSFELDETVLSVASNHNETQIAASGDGGLVALFDSDLQPLDKLEHTDLDALELRFSPDDRQLAAGAWFKLLVWDLASGKLKKINTEHTGALHSIDFSPDGKMIASIGRHTDAQVRLTNLTTGQVERRLSPHKLCGFTVRYSHDGRFVATASDDESIHLYDISTPYAPRVLIK